MSSNEIRNLFLEYFEAKGHSIVPSAPIVLKNDPTLMFTNAGMNQFKDFFLGNKTPVSLRVADSQKCLRVSGKHNDLEQVGYDTYHHTMFEMLGNWSFGDYFKKEAIEWAWDLLTRVFKIDKDRLYVTVFAGNRGDNLTSDGEAYTIWADLVDESRILSFSKKDNFWEMGDAGPCGPSSEIHIDLRSDEEREKTDAVKLINQDHPEVIELWNLVFIQFNRSASGKLSELPQKHVDTGMGFERLCMALQGKKSNYDTDIFQPIISEIARITGVEYGAAGDTDIALRVISDHTRAVAFAIADGQLPSNNGAGYVIRRILRRSIRYAYSFLNYKEPLVFQLIPILAKSMAMQFNELDIQQELIIKVIREEEENFLRTLSKGIDRFNKYIHKLNNEEGENASSFKVDGKFAFELYDTYGFPIDLTGLLAKEHRLPGVDMDSFKRCLDEQKNRSRQAALYSTEDWIEILKDDKEEFIGYDTLETKVKITKYRRVAVTDREYYQLVFNITPFYAEGGGQVGDTGYIESKDEKILIIDTKREHDLIIHFANKIPDNPDAEFHAVVNSDNRHLTANNHSATHLLHEALRKVLGGHVEQKGSLVNPDYLRFDFSHFQKVTEDELEKIEAEVNEVIRKNELLEEHREMPIEEAKQMGALALFGEKYGDVVRVIKFGDSIELCGGTHVHSTGQVGLFKIISEGSVAAGIRRIEAITGPGALKYVNQKLEQLKKVLLLVRNNKDIVAGVEALIGENQQLQKENEKLMAAQVNQIKDDLKQHIEELDGINYIASLVPLNSADAIKNLSFQLKNEVDNLFLILGAQFDGKAYLSIMIDEELVKRKSLNAGNIIRELAKDINGGGGGQPFYATAGGKNPQGLNIVFDKTKQLVSGITINN